MDRSIIVFYLGVGNMDSQEIENYVDSVSKRFFSVQFVENNNCEVLIIPTREINSRVECINPVYITDNELIQRHNTLMSEFNESLNQFIIEKKK